MRSAAPIRVGTTDSSGCLIHCTACFAQLPDFSVIYQSQARYNAYYSALLAIIRSSAWPSVTSHPSYVFLQQDREWPSSVVQSNSFR